MAGHGGWKLQGIVKPSSSLEKPWILVLIMTQHAKMIRLPIPIRKTEKKTFSLLAIVGSNVLNHHIPFSPFSKSSMNVGYKLEWTFLSSDLKVGNDGKTKAELLKITSQSFLHEVICCNKLEILTKTLQGEHWVRTFFVPGMRQPISTKELLHRIANWRTNQD